MKHDKTFRPDQISAYFRVEWLSLTLVTVSGLLYNVGLLATPWFEGRLAQCLADILGGSETAASMAVLVLAYILVTLTVQAARFIKRFYVRRFANNINRRMKGVLYANLVRQSRASLEEEGAGELMTKAISDVDDCVEGMRKFTTEVFDTGVALAGYAVMLFVYDWRLALLSLLFTPVSYVCAAWMKKPEELSPLAVPAPADVTLENLSFAYGDTPVFSGLTLTAHPGDIIGITGPVACGKSSPGRVFLCEAPYGGSAKFGAREFSSLTPRQIAATVGYLGHDPELSADTIQNNVLCGDEQDAAPYLAAVALQGEVRAMEDGPDTVIGSGGTRLSGGQAQRLALARTLAHPRPVLVLDDPFSALDRGTEDAVFANLQSCAKDKVVFLISHRLYHFPQLQRVIFMEDGKTTVGTHAGLMASEPVYRQLYESQTGGEPA